MTAEQRTAFLADRRKGIGASDVAALFGLSKWATPMSVWADKLGLTEDSPQEEHQKWGHILEPVIGEQFTARTGIEVAKPLLCYVDPECPVLRSNLDFECETGEPLDAKTARSAKYVDVAGRPQVWGPDGTDEVPDEILFQIQTQIAARAADRGFVAVLIGGSDFRIYTIPRSDSLIRAIRERATEFWNKHVVTRQAPELDWSHPLTPEIVRKLATITPGLVVELDDPNDPFCQVAQDFNLLRAAEKIVKRRKDTAQARLIEMAGGATEVRFACGKWTHKQQSKREHVVKASTSKVARLTWQGTEPDASIVLDRLPRAYDTGGGDDDQGADE